MKPLTTWKEEIADGEEAAFEAYAERLRGLQRRVAGDGAASTSGSPTPHGDVGSRRSAPGASRALHAKGFGVAAMFTVLPDLPEHARIGLFADPSTFKAYVRFSNGSLKRQHDKVGDVRGIAIKVLGVPGKKIIPGMEDATTQDFLMIRSRTMPFRTVHEFVEVVSAGAGSPLVALPKILWSLGLSRGLGLLGELSRGLSAPMTSLATTPYYSMAPIRVGEYAARFQLMPHEKAEGPLEKGGPDYLGDELRARLAKQEVSYDFQLQFYVDPERTPIEDPTRPWSEEDSKPLTVARLTLCKLDDAARAAKVAELVEGLSFDPWHALVAHKPIGELMRARNPAYRLSTQERKAKPEPDGKEL